MKYSTMKLVNISTLTKKPCKCMKCHKGFDSNADVVQISYLGLGDGNIYAHKPCATPVFYGNEENENLGGTDNVTFEKTPRVSSEVEMFNSIINPDGIYYSQRERQERAFNLLISGNDPELTDLYVKFLVFGTKHKEIKTLQDIGLDSSTALEGHITELSIEGSAKLYRNLTPRQVKIINDPHNGAHIHVSCVRCSFDRVFKPVFDVLIDYFKTLSVEDRIKYFGSDFRGYADDYVGYCDHGSSINMSHIPTAELRLARFNNAEQYIKLMKVWRGVVKVFNTYAYKVDNGTWTVNHLGEKLVKEFKHIDGVKYAKGR